jgi:polar amino acid transport system substrate-binding protein
MLGRFLVLTIAVAAFNFAAGFDVFAQEFSLTPEEQAFLQKHPVISLGTEKAWEPYVIVRSDGSIEGYDADILKRINQLTGANFQLIAGSWRDMQERAKRREIDGLSTGGVHDERKIYLNFSDYYISLKKLVLTSRGNPRKILNDRDLAGKTIAIHRGNLVDEKLAKKYPDSKILAVDTIEEMIRAVVNGTADATFGNGATLYQANRIGLPYLEIAYELEQTLELAFGVRKDWPEAISILNKGLRQISQRERISLIDKWFLTSNKPDYFSALTLSDEELQYVAANPELTLVNPPHIPPLFFAQNGKCSGLLPDYLQLLEKKTGLSIDCSEKNEKTARGTPLLKFESRLAAQFRDPDFFTIYENPLVIIAGNELTYLENLHVLEGKRVTHIEELVPEEYLENVEPGLVLIPVKTHHEMIEAVAKGDADAAVSGILAATQAIADSGRLNVRIVGDLREIQQLGLKLDAPPELKNIFLKALNSIRPEEQTALKNKWLSVRYEHGTDYRLLFGTLVICAVICVVILAWSRKLAQLNSRIQSYLLLINQNLLLVSLDQDGKIVAASEAFCRWAGMQAEQLIGMDHAEFFAPDKTEIIDESRHDEGYMEMVFLGPDKAPRHIEINPLGSPDLQSDSTRYIIHDITEKILGLKNKHEQRIIDQKMAILSDLHDGFGGVVTAMSIAADNALRKASVTEKNHILQEISALAREGATEMRLMMNALEQQELSWETLVSDLRQVVNILISGREMQLVFHRPDFFPDRSLPQEDYFSLYRWFKEVVINAVKHSSATQLEVFISCTDNFFEIRIKDDGCGFVLEENSAGHGMRSLSSRAADLAAEMTIDSRAGTCLTLKVPLGRD